MERKAGLKRMKRGKGWNDEKTRLMDKIRKIKKKIGKCESEHKTSGIYGEDQRYHRLRSRFKKIYNLNNKGKGL